VGLDGAVSDRSAKRPGFEFWDERYGAPGFAYGTMPNRWLEARASAIRPGGRVLTLGEGEGRNAVWLAEQGFSVDAVDASAVGLEKSRELAARRGVRLRTQVDDLATYRPESKAYDALVLVFVHLPPTIRNLVHTAGARALRPGGVLIIEAFTPLQLGRPSGGPRQADLLYEVATLRSDFPGVDWQVLEEAEIELDEGPFHRGAAAVVHGVGRTGTDLSRRSDESHGLST
jgi:SAM-dependent methyltransferase